MNSSPFNSPSAPVRTYDIPLLLGMTALLVFGMVMLFSASWDFSLSAYKDPMYMFKHQLTWLGLGSLVAFILSRLDYHHWRKLAVPALAITILLLVYVLVMGETHLGVQRDLCRQGSCQPSELAKLVAILYLCVWLYSKREALHDISFGLIPLGIILGMICGLIYLQPDISAAATVLILGGVLFFLAGGDLKQIGVLLVIAVLVGWVVIQLSATGRQRVDDFMAGIKDPLQASYHVRRSFEAIVNGGWLGVGIGQSKTKLTGLPVPPTDSIFAVIAEELGLLGSILLMVFYTVIVWRGFVIARRSPDLLGTFLATGLVMWIGMEALINIAVMVGLLPFAGNALPFVSYGGSSMVVGLGAVGILFNISRQQGPASQTDAEWRSNSAAINLRWWNRRRRISSPRRSKRPRIQASGS